MELTDQVFPPNTPITIYTISRTLYAGKIVNCPDGFIAIRLTAVPTILGTTTNPAPTITQFAVGTIVYLNIKNIEAIA
jgi:hypothetical protein